MSLNLSENALRNITIPRQLPHLMELNLSIQCEKQAAPTDSGGFCSVFSDSFSQSLFDNCPQLQSINISMTGITSLSCLERCDSLRQIICLKTPQRTCRMYCRFSMTGSYTSTCLTAQLPKIDDYSRLSAPSVPIFHSLTAKDIPSSK